MNSILILLWILAAVIIVGSTILSVIVVRKQRHHEEDSEISPITLKHKILANPILIAYALFPIVILIIIGVFYIMFFR